MYQRPLRHAIALSLGALLACAGTAAADTARADGDVATTIIEVVADAGVLAPGETASVNVGLVLTCTGTTHVDPGQTVTASIDSALEPLDGKILSVTDGTVGPAPADWPADGTACPVPAPTFSGGSPSVVTFTAPTTPGTDHRFSLMYHRSISPFGMDDPGAVRQVTAIDIVVDVVVNTPPSVILPAVAAMATVEGDTTGGWTADWSGLGATDLEDDPDPSATCYPVAGTVLAPGETTVTCAVTDSGLLTDSDSFVVNVVDSTAPTLVGVPGDLHLTTSDPTGTTITYLTPGSTDTVDAAPTVACLPASGTHVGPGLTTVTCSATDASRNRAEASFDVTVEYVAPHAASASWLEPVAGSGTTFSANRGRTLPIKVELVVDGTVRDTGEATLIVTPCEGGSAVILPLEYGGGRWNAGLDTAPLVGSCHTLTATIDGLVAGSFRLELRGAEPTKASKGPVSAGPATSTSSVDVTSTATPDVEPAKSRDTKVAKPKDARPAKTSNGKK